MNAPVKTILRWLLVVFAVLASSFAVFMLLMGFSMLPDRSVVAALSAIGIAPRAAIEAVHRLDFFIAMLIWVVPAACAVGFAAHTQQRKAFRWGISIAILPFAAFCFFLGRQDSRIDVQCIAIGAALVVLAALGLSFSKLKFPRMVTIANLVAVLLLLSPSAIALAHRTNTPPEAKQLWSVVLQPQEWFQQSMNTGSEYAATRQVVFAGDRVIAVLDVGLTSTTTQDKWSISNYRIVSLDAKTGVNRNELNFTGRWGGMPYIYATKAGSIDVQSNPPRLLNPDLTTASDSGAEAQHAADTQRVPSSNFPGQATMPNGSVLKIERNYFRVLDNNGQLIGYGNLLEYGTYAGASLEDHRFAIQSSYSEGDPDFLVYEYFTIYDTQSGKAIATIHVKDLPERQSWSAFSPDGRYFVAGNPNKLTMYLLP